MLPAGPTVDPTTGAGIAWIDPGYDLAGVHLLIPCQRHTLLKCLYRHRADFPARYRRDGRRRRRRVLYASEINRLRQLLLYGPAMELERQALADRHRQYTSQQLAADPASPLAPPAPA